MTVLHSWPIVMGVLAASVPVLIHYMTRPKPVVLRISTLRFVREVVSQRRAHQKLRDLLILLLRAAAVLLLAFALARPFFGSHAPFVTGDDGHTTRVVLLDTSQSMAAGERGVQVFEQARARAAELLSYRPDMRANLLEAAAEPRSFFDRSSTNFAALREGLSAAMVRPERLNTRSALARAAEMLADQARPDDRRELFIVSDFQRSNWAAADFSVLPEDTHIELASAASETAPANVAILDARCEGSVLIGHPARCQVEIGNFSASPRELRATVTVGAATLELTGHCPAYETTVLDGEILVRDVGWQAGTCELMGVEDALAADNTRSFTVDVRTEPTVGLVSRHTANTPHTPTYYLERAIAPLATTDAAQSLRVVRLDPAQLEDEAAARVDLLVIDHPGKISAAGLRRLGALLRRGRSVLYVASEPIDATNLRQLGEAVGSDLQLPVEFLPPPTTASRRDLVLADAERDRPPFRVFADGLVEQLSPLRFGGGLATRRVEGASRDDITAVFNDRSAALVTTACGAGMLAVLNADLSRSNVATSSAFVPLIGELVEHLLDRGTQSTVLPCGEPAVVYLPPEAGTPAELSIKPPAELSAEAADLVEDRLGVVLRLRPARGPGVWRLFRQDRPVFAAAAVIPAGEADLRPLEAAVLTERLAGGRQIEFHSAADDEARVNAAWSWLAAACVGCLLCEFALLRVFRS